jgi:PAS domain S-box-containing protein
MPFSRWLCFRPGQFRLLPRICCSVRTGLLRCNGAFLPAVSFFLCFLFLSQITVAQSGPVKRVLILNEGNASYPAIDSMDRGIQSVLSKSPFRLDFYVESLDTIPFPDSESQQVFRDFFLHKYRDRQPDVIITVGPNPLRLMREAHRQAFGDVPIIFCMPTLVASDPGPLDRNFTGVETEMAAGETLDAAMRLLPGTKHVVVVSGQSRFDKDLQSTVQEQLKNFAGRVDVSYLAGLAVPDLLERLRHLPDQTIVLLTSLSQDAAGNRFKLSEAGPMVASAANAPVFSLFDTAIGHGEVGGDVFSFSEQGKIAGSMALRVLQGERPQDIPLAKGLTVYTFDANALGRWGISERSLPAGSIVLNHQPTFWELNKRYVIAGAFVLLLQTFVIVALLWQRDKRRQIEAKLTNSNVQLLAAMRAQELAEEVLRESEERFRLVANTAPVMIWMAGTDKLCNYFNRPWLDFTGRTIDQEMGNGWADRVHAEEISLCLETYAKSFNRREPFDITYRMLRHDGAYRWIHDQGVPRFHADGSFAGYIGACTDVTERKLAEEALSTVSQKLIQAHEEERNWLARELHDDVNQRLALLAVNLDLLYQGLPASAHHARLHAADIKQQIKDLGMDVQALSHRLHSSKLEYIGLSAAAEAFCRDFSERTGADIAFSSENVSRSLPEEISLCLFRVLQEALQNASKHSGSKRYQISLTSRGDAVELTVSDSGRGFNPEEALKSSGIGLTSMRERIKIVHGELRIDSQNEQGTIIRARVPMRPITKVALAAATGRH